MQLGSDGVIMSDSTDQNRQIDLEIEELRAFTRPTSRVTSTALEDRLYKIFPVLDHGFVRVIDYMGDDTSIVQAARVSYGKGTKSVRNDEGLIRYLMRHRHSTPFEMCEIKFHIKLPIFVARQWIRHRTANVNEYSARYSMLDREFYIPAPEHLAAQSDINNQGRGDVLRDEEAAEVLDMLKADAVRSYDRYETLLNERQNGRVINEDKQGLARELARMTLPLSAYTQWYWKVDLHNLNHFLSLRMDPHAQYEIRAFADVMFDIVRDWVPLTAKAFEDYRVNSFDLSGPMLAAVRRMVRGETVDADNSGLSGREWRELQAALGLSD